ncbi:unnamed protein product [Nippostrongylus brasiliensis]|uniref:Cytochrome c oxidase polypeptide VIa n=1 Tax=Nippostrongylus brasiliensis TaxID=27835 RepID=A0A0N4YHI1_NIPBR|nr:hypothetical protein Q1695_013978 [Nippostrongylus brasiliensis]VDL79915.1 unnamed protein product [Nippostrongylus brasiliensis]
MLRLRPAIVTVQKRCSSGGGSFLSGGWGFDNYKKQFTTNLRESGQIGAKWKSIFLFASIPCLAITMYGAHREHQKKSKEERPQYVAYEFLNVRKRPFPWGDGNHSLFHNPREQYVPGVGFEQERKQH